MRNQRKKDSAWTFSGARQFFFSKRTKCFLVCFTVSLLESFCADHVLQNLF